MKGRSNRKAVANTPKDLASPADDNGPVVILPTYPPDVLPLQTPRLLSRQQAAAYCSVSPETFDDYRRRAIVPDPIIGTNRWDRKLIDIWLDKASGITLAAATSLDTWRASRDG